MNWDRNAKKICQFVRRHYRPWSNAPMRRLRDYFRWYADRGLLSVVWQRGQVVGVGTVRFFHLPSHYRLEFVNFEDGPLARLNLYGAIRPIFIPQLVAKMAKGRNENKLYLWHRDVEELGPPRRYPLAKFKRLLLKLIEYERRQPTYTS